MKTRIDMLVYKRSLIASKFADEHLSMEKKFE